MRTLMRALGKFWGSTTRLSLPTKFFIGAAALAAVIWLGTWIAADITAHTARFTGSAADSLARATLARSKAHRRHRSVWKAAGDERSKTRSKAAQSRIARDPNTPCY